jgi:hypothetical protein
MSSKATVGGVAPPGASVESSAASSATGSKKSVVGAKKKGPSNLASSSKGKSRKIASVIAAEANAAESANVASTIASTGPASSAGAASAAVANSAEADEAALAEDSMQMVLRPAKKPRVPATAGDVKKGFKKVCIASNESEAPASLRGKCATRKCAKGKCTYNGRREMFDWVASRGEI